jgi:hypothetical protein
MENHMTRSEVQAPGGIFFLPPGAKSGAGATHSTIEFKGAISTLVATPVPGTVLLRNGMVEPLDGHHLTIHNNLMVHLKCGSSIIELAPPRIKDGRLIEDATHLVTFAAAPPESTQPHYDRIQHKWEGGSAIISLVPDDNYDPVATYLLIDVWATRPDFNAPGRLPGQWPSARAALSNDGSAVLGPVRAEWGFRREPRPECVFYFRCWYADVLKFNGAPFITVPSKTEFSKHDLFAFTRKPLAYEIRGWAAGVTVAFGQFVFRLNLDEARVLADTIEKTGPTEIRGNTVVPIVITGGTFLFHLPPEEAAKVPGFLRSAIKSARGESE